MREIPPALTVRPGEPPGAAHRPSRGDACRPWAQFRELGFSEDDAEPFPEVSPSPRGHLRQRRGISGWQRGTCDTLRGLSCRRGFAGKPVLCSEIVQERREEGRGVT